MFVDCNNSLCRASLMDLTSSSGRSLCGMCQLLREKPVLCN